MKSQIRHHSRIHVQDGGQKEITTEVGSKEMVKIKGEERYVQKRGLRERNRSTISVSNCRGRSMEADLRRRFSPARRKRGKKRRRPGKKKVLDRVMSHKERSVKKTEGGTKVSGSFEFSSPSRTLSHRREKKPLLKKGLIDSLLFDPTGI